MADNTNSVNDRLQQASQGGTPKLDPDQQRRYLGTFRERVSLIISQSDADNPQAQKALSVDMTKHKNYLLTINASQLNDDIVAQYEKIALTNNVKFTTDQDSNYQDPQLSYAVVFANPTEAINQSPITWNKKYTKLNSVGSHQSIPRDQSTSHSFWSKLENWF